MSTSAPTPSVCPLASSFSQRALTRQLALQQFAVDHQDRFDLLTVRERQILVLVASGLTNEQIGQQLFRSKHTIRTHRNRIYRQLKINSVVEAVRWAQAFDLL